MATETTKAMTFVNPATGEIVEIDLSRASVPTQGDVREAMPLMDVHGVFAVLGVQFGVGANFEGEYARVLILTSGKKLVECKTAGSEIIDALKRNISHGGCTPGTPTYFKTGTNKTSGRQSRDGQSHNVHKLMIPSPAEVEAFKASQS